MNDQLTGHTLPRIFDIFKEMYITAIHTQAVAFVIALAFITNEGLSQDRIDSLYTALDKARNADQKLNTYLKLADELMNINIRKVPAILDSAKNLSLTKNNKDGLGKVNQLSGIERWLNGYYQEAEFYLHQAAHLHKAQNDSFNLARDFSYLGLVFHYQAKHDSTLYYHQEALKINRQLNLKKRIAHNLDNIALTHHQLGNFNKVIKYTSEALDIRSRMEGYVSRTNFYNFGGKAFSQKALNEAIQYHKKVLREEMSQGSGPEKIGPCLNNIASTYHNVEMYDSAIYYFKKGAEVTYKSGLMNRYAGYLNELGETYLANGQFLEAESTFTESSAIWDSIGTRISISIVKYNLAQAYLELDKIRSGKYLAQSVFNLAKEMSQNSFFSRTAYLYARFLLKEDNFQQALEYTNIALNNALKINIQDRILEGYSLMAEINNLIGHHQQVVNYLEKYNQLRDSLYNAEGSLQLAQMLVVYETERKNREIDILNAENLNKSLQLRQRNLITLLSLGLVILLIGMVLNRYRYIRKLASQKKFIEKQKDHLEIANREKELMLSEIHHRVKNNLQVIISMLSLQSRNITNEDVKTELERNKDRLSAMAIIHQQLYKNDHEAWVNLKDYVESLINHILISYEKQKIDLQLNIDQVKVDFDTAISIGLILNELVCNSIKYAFHKTKHPLLLITLKCEGNNMSLRVKDNGEGYHREEVRQGSFGLRLVNSLVKELNGKIESLTLGGVDTIITLSTEKKSPPFQSFDG